MNPWIEVGSDILWFIKWPLLCFLWMYLGVIGTENEDPIIPFFLATIYTIVMANYIL